MRITAPCCKQFVYFSVLRILSVTRVSVLFDRFPFHFHTSSIRLMRRRIHYLLHVSSLASSFRLKWFIASHYVGRGATSSLCACCLPIDEWQIESECDRQAGPRTHAHVLATHYLTLSGVKYLNCSSNFVLSHNYAHVSRLSINDSGAEISILGPY